MESATTRAGGDSSARSWAPHRIGRTEVRIALVVAMAISMALTLWFGRDGTFSLDEIAWFAQSPHLTLRGAIDPYNGHLILTSRLVYAAIFNVFGPDYWVIRLLTSATVLLTAVLFFVFAERRIGSLPALAPTLVLLFYGSDYTHVLVGNGFTILLAVAAGIGAMLAIERRDRVGDVAAFLLLCLSLATYSFGIAFAAGVAVFVLIGADRWRRAWVFLIPGILYAPWFVWSRGKGVGSEASVHVSNLLLAPNWALNSVAHAMESLLGLGYASLGTGWGPVLAVIAFVALGWRLWRGNIGPALWAVLAIPAVLWVIEAAAALPEIRVPSSDRYLFATTIAILMVGAEAVRGVPWRRRAIVILYLAAVVGLATNIFLLRNASNELRTSTAATRSALTAVELSGGRVPPAGATRDLTLGQLRQPGVASGYVEASKEFGSPAFSVPDLHAQPEPVRERVDDVLAGGLGVRMTPATGPATNCHRVAGAGGQSMTVRLPPGGAVLETKGPPAPVSLRRFGTAFTVKEDTLKPNTPTALVIPRDSAPDPWYLSTATSPLSVCNLSSS